MADGWLAGCLEDTAEERVLCACARHQMSQATRAKEDPEGRLPCWLQRRSVLPIISARVSSDKARR